MSSRKYFLDLSDLQYKQVRLPWKSKLIRLTLWAIASVIVTLLYTAFFNGIFGSPKEKLLDQEIESIKLKYSLIGREIDNSMKILNDLELSDGNRYRPVLDMDSIPVSIRKMGTGGISRYEELDGYYNSSLMIAFRSKVDDIRNRTTIQYESFKAIEEKRNEWKREMEYLPMISPVNVYIGLATD
jgi:hypothetical protein